MNFDKKDFTFHFPAFLTLVMLTLTLCACGKRGEPDELEVTRTPIVSLTPTATLGIGSTMVSPVDGMLLMYIPEGEFLMGSKRGSSLGFSNESPEHQVYLGAFWIDKTEVSNAQYSLCVESGACSEPTDCYRESPTYGDATKRNYPVNCAAWQDAQDYCEWAGRRLPTEAEWEKAARGTDGYTYPWGYGHPNGDMANFCDASCERDLPDLSVNNGFADTAPVGSYPQGASPYGVMDMAGNVSEWVADWYDKDYYEYSPSENPLGPSMGDSHVLRGGSALDLYLYVRAAFRAPFSELQGFRCAYPPAPRPTLMSPTVTLTLTPIPTTTVTRPSPTLTRIPATTAAGPSPTLGPLVTRTPGQPAQCPGPSGQTPTISSTGPGDTVVEIFEPQLLDYLNNVGSAAGLEAALSPLTMLDGTWKARTQVKTIDVTGNTTPDVVVELTFYESGQYFEGALFVFMCDDGHYVGNAIASAWGQVLPSGEPEGIRAIRDMNLDGVPEIVYSQISVGGTHAYYMRKFRILEWDGQQFVNLIPKDQYGFYAQVDSGDGVIRDTDGDGTLELVLTNGLGEAYPDLGPQRKRTDIWAWDGYAFTLDRWEYTAPVFRIHAIWDGDDASSFGDYDKALAFYQQAIFDEKLFGWSQGRLWPDWQYGGAATPTPDPEERPRLSAYGRYRILLLHAVQGLQAEAQIVHETLQEKFPEGTVGHPYAELATVFWEEYTESGDVGLACEKSAEYAAAHKYETLTHLGRDFYGYGQREYVPEDICPFE